jgi:hypothetical protein
LNNSICHDNVSLGSAITSSYTSSTGGKLSMAYEAPIFLVYDYQKISVSGMKNQLGFFISWNPIEIDNLSA